MRTKFVAAAAVAAYAMASLPAHAATLTLGAGWEPFYYINPAYPNPYGGPIMDYYSGDTDFTFTLTQDEKLKVTDAYYNLDIFDIVINGVDQGLTSSPNPAFAYTDDFDVAYSSPYFSHGTYILGAGTYDVTGTAVYSPYGYGVAGIELAPVPEPAAWAMMLIGFGAIGGLARRRARASAVTA